MSQEGHAGKQRGPQAGQAALGGSGGASVLGSPGVQSPPALARAVAGRLRSRRRERQPAQQIVRNGNQQRDAQRLRRAPDRELLQPVHDAPLPIHALRGRCPLLVDALGFRRPHALVVQLGDVPKLLSWRHPR